MNDVVYQNDRIFATLEEMSQKTFVLPRWIKVGIPAALIVVLYNDWVLSPWLNHHLSSVASLISEISARTQPHHELYRLIDTTAGVITLLLLPVVAKYLKHHKITKHWLLLGVMALIGLGSIVDASLPISCAPSVDKACNLAATNSLVTDAHLVESTLVGAVTVLAPVVWWWQYRRRKNLISRASLAFVVLQAAVGLTILAMQGLRIEIIGILQRMYELGIGAWLATVIGVALNRLPVRLTVEEPELQALPELSVSDNAEA